MRRTGLRPQGSKSDILIIGGGASGLAAACVLSGSAFQVRVLEAQQKAGRKLLATGNGRCNLMQSGRPLYFGDAAFACQALEHCSQKQVLAFFHGLGLTTHEEDGGLVYPASMQAATVLDCLLLPIRKNPRCQVLTDSRVTAISREGAGFAVRTARGEAYAAPRLIVAAGSPAQPRLSGSGDVYPLLTALGHRLVTPRPALSKLHSRAEAVRGLRGLRLPAVCTLCDGDQPVSRTQGEVLFTQEGVSGVCAMQLSRDAGEILARGGRPTLYLDFSPLLGLLPRRYGRAAPGPAEENYPRVLAWLEERAARLPREAWLLGALPRLLLARQEGLDARGCARMLSAFPVPVTAVSGFDHAQVASGGIDCRDVDPATMESRIIPGLYLTGEVLNVDGDCGGHNLLFAWASGILAARAAGRR